ncbi:hypothetical protein VAE308_1330001 [Vibrio aestuarianus]|uniref:Uncharacterized protein n=1 Tax=Vibrio aestuarianus TaxID=28171 RepID=A0ABN8TPT0_9VIBR|nr:hypothetical protein VAE063_1020011 [Vibrio aestuarianus]CAH8202256.1 hypothetical protein VAE063_1030002 [Vibrio aestuarianus]CAH8228787.1 hypothetical protein VAE308_1320001 [Vibrio aestuarianus]CAH8228822.1 hypothetical protein VAE308_1330001 [Vibrio aestuarianus]
MNLGWKGFGVPSYTPDKSQLLNYLASGTFREELCLLSSLVWFLCCRNS